MRGSARVGFDAAGGREEQERRVTETPPAARRPAAVSVVAWLHVVQMFVLLIGGVALLVFSAGDLDSAVVTAADLLFQAETGRYGALLILLGVVTAVVTWGLFRLRPWAWLGAMIIQGFDLAVALLAYVNEQPDYLTMALSVLIVLSLNQREVRQVFRTEGY